MSSKLTELNELTNPTNADLLYAVDSANGESKKLSLGKVSLKEVITKDGANVTTNTEYAESSRWQFPIELDNGNLGLFEHNKFTTGLNYTEYDATTFAVVNRVNVFGIANSVDISQVTKLSDGKILLVWTDYTNGQMSYMYLNQDGTVAIAQQNVPITGGIACGASCMMNVPSQGLNEYVVIVGVSFTTGQSTIATVSNAGAILGGSQFSMNPLVDGDMYEIFVHQPHDVLGVNLLINDGNITGQYFAMGVSLTTYQQTSAPVAVVPLDTWGYGHDIRMTPSVQKADGNIRFFVHDGVNNIAIDTDTTGAYIQTVNFLPSRWSHSMFKMKDGNYAIIYEDPASAVNRMYAFIDGNTFDVLGTQNLPSHSEAVTIYVHAGIDYQNKMFILYSVWGVNTQTFDALPLPAIVGTDSLLAVEFQRSASPEQTVIGDSDTLLLRDNVNNLNKHTKVATLGAKIIDGARSPSPSITCAISTAYEAEGVTVTINSYNPSFYDYSFSVTAGLIADNQDGTLTWTLPEVTVDTNHTISVYQLAVGEILSNASQHTINVKNLPVVDDQQLVYDNVSMTEFTDLTNTQVESGVLEALAISQVSIIASAVINSFTTTTPLEDGTPLKVDGAGLTVDIIHPTTYHYTPANTTIGDTIAGLFPTRTASFQWLDSGNKLLLQYNTSGLAIYNCSTPYDHTTMVVGTTMSRLYSAGAFMSADGTKLIIGSYNPDTAYGYTLSTPFDLTTAVLDGNTLATGLVVKSYYITDDGLKLYATTDANNTSRVHQWNLSTAWDLSTAVSHGQSPVNHTRAFPVFNDSGERLILLSDQDKVMRFYKLTTAWDITTMAVDGTASGFTNVDSALVSQDGLDLLYSDWSGNIRTYTLDASFNGVVDTGNTTISGADYIVDTTVVTGGLTPSLAYIDGHIAKSNVVEQDGVDTDWLKMKTISSKYEFENLSTGESTADTLITAGEPITEGDILMVGGTTVALAELDTTGKLTTNTATVVDMSALSAFDSFATGVNDPRGIEVRPDGKKLYFHGYTGKFIREYTMSTPFDLTTLALTNTFDYNAILPSDYPVGLMITPDGVTFYLHDNNSSLIYKFTMSTPWDMSTASYIGTIGGYTTAMRHFSWADDGNKVVYADGGTDTILTRNLNVPYSLEGGSTAGTSIAVATEDNNPNSSYLTNDGTRLFYCGTTTGTIYEYELSTPFDLSTAVKTANTIVHPASVLTLSPKGDMMFVAYNASITQYNATGGSLFAYKSQSVDTTSITGGEVPVMGYGKVVADSNLKFEFGQGWVDAVEVSDTLLSTPALGLNPIVFEKTYNDVALVDGVGNGTRTLKSRVDFTGVGKNLTYLFAILQKEVV